MKTLILSLMLSSSCFAGEILVMDEPASFNNPSFVSGDVSAKESTGRAFVELMFDSPISSESVPVYQKYDVEGLHLEGTAVVLDVDGSSIVCANMETRGIFRTRKAVQTGNCKIETVVEGNRLRSYLVY